MKVAWTSGLDAQAADEVRSNFDASALTRKRLETLLQDKLEFRRRISGGVDQYANASWPYLQADLVGYERAITEIISLIYSKHVE